MCSGRHKHPRGLRNGKHQGQHLQAGGVQRGSCCCCQSREGNWFIPRVQSTQTALFRTESAVITENWHHLSIIQGPVTGFSFRRTWGAMLPCLCLSKGQRVLFLPVPSSTPSLCPAGRETSAFPCALGSCTLQGSAHQTPLSLLDSRGRPGALMGTVKSSALGG